MRQLPPHCILRNGKYKSFDFFYKCMQIHIYPSNYAKDYFISPCFSYCVICDTLLLSSTNTTRSVVLLLVRRHIAVCHNNNFITLLNTPCRRTVKAYNARIFSPAIVIRFKALTVVYVNYLHLFIFKYTGRFQKCKYQSLYFRHNQVLPV